MNPLKLLFGEFIKIFKDVRALILAVKTKRNNASIAEKKTIE
jgi:hypothetical protein